MPGGTSTGTVEPTTTATRSYSLSTDNPLPEVHQFAPRTIPRLSWCPTHKFGQEEGFCFLSQATCSREQTACHESLIPFSSTITLPVPDTPFRHNTLQHPFQYCFSRVVSAKGKPSPTWTKTGSTFKHDVILPWVDRKSRVLQYLGNGDRQRCCNKLGH